MLSLNAIGERNYHSNIIENKINGIIKCRLKQSCWPSMCVTYNCISHPFISVNLKCWKKLFIFELLQFEINSLTQLEYKK